MSKSKAAPKMKKAMPSKPKIKDYDDYGARADKGEFDGMSAVQIDQKFDVGWLQLLAWMARYDKEVEESNK